MSAGWGRAWRRDQKVCSRCRGGPVPVSLLLINMRTYRPQVLSQRVLCEYIERLMGRHFVVPATSRSALDLSTGGSANWSESAKVCQHKVLICTTFLRGESLMMSAGMWLFLLPLPWMDRPSRCSCRVLLLCFSSHVCYIPGGRHSLPQAARCLFRSFGRQGARAPDLM